MKRHPRVEDLKQLYEDINKEYLEIAPPTTLPFTSANSEQS